LKLAVRRTTRLKQDMKRLLRGGKDIRPLSKVNFYPIKSSGQIPVLKEV